MDGLAGGSSSHGRQRASVNAGGGVRGSVSSMMASVGGGGGKASYRSRADSSGSSSSDDSLDKGHNALSSALIKVGAPLAGFDCSPDTVAFLSMVIPCRQVAVRLSSQLYCCREQSTKTQITESTGCIRPFDM